MMLSDVCYLIHENPEMHGAFDNDTELDLGRYANMDERRTQGDARERI